MIDIHSHLLPGIDDGAADIQQALALARIAAEDGITHMVFTPHIQPGMYENNAHSIATALTGFRAAILEAGIPLELAAAAEVRISPEMIPMVGAATIPLYRASDGRHSLLLEFPHSHIPPGSDKLIYWLRSRDIGCLIAHPERNKELMRDMDKLSIFTRMGCRVQVTAGAIAGAFGEQPKQAARWLLERGLIDVLATDAHNEKHRPPLLSPGVKAAAAIIGEQAAHVLVSSGPWSLVGGMFNDDEG
ncbi:MAG: CpsB/CapC family capsule biosynthesis tyrosine phosphatase [Mariprofundus sp.]